LVAVDNIESDIPIRHSGQAGHTALNIHLAAGWNVFALFDPAPVHTNPSGIEQSLDFGPRKTRTAAQKAVYPATASLVFHHEAQH
jgi:hypothetical protein